MENEDLVDVWRNQNLKGKDDTFFSDRHKSWSRIDLILMTKEQELKTKRTDIKPRNILDHCPLIWCVKDKLRTWKLWRLNEDLLGKQEFIDQLRIEINEYFNINETPEVHPAIA